MYRPFSRAAPPWVTRAIPFWQFDLTREIGSEPQLDRGQQNQSNQALALTDACAGNAGLNEPQVAGPLRPFDGLTSKAFSDNPHRAEQQARSGRTEGTS